MQRLVLAGLNHTTAPLAIRERLAFSAPQQREVLALFHQRFPDAEAVLLSTCNRVELYIARALHGKPQNPELIEFLAASRQLAAPDLVPHLYQKSDRDVVVHLFSVVCSLDSMVLGETQILGQVRSAYDLAREVPATGAMLNPLFQRAIAVGKQVMSETALNEGRLSVASIAVDYARRIFDHFADKTVLCIGAGKMTTLALQNFAGLKPGKLLITNRNPQKAQDLAAQFGGEPRPFERLGEHLVAADIVISCTGSTLPIITRAQFEPLLRQRRYRPIFLIDIALPRDIEEAVGDLENVYLYNLDDLQQAVSATQSQRIEAVAAARKIVEQQVEEFARWHQARQMGPLIDQLYQRSHQIAQEEVLRTLNKLGLANGEEKAHLEELARRIVNKLLHDPVQMLRHAETLQAPGAHYVQTVTKLFNLARPDAPPKDKPDPSAKP